VISLRASELQLKSKNELDEWHIQGYHGIGHPLYLEIDSDTVNFYIKVRCPFLFFAFDKGSYMLTIVYTLLPQSFCKSQDSYFKRSERMLSFISNLPDDKKIGCTLCSCTREWEFDIGVGPR
jgi:hypothetical protein